MFSWLVAEIKKHYTFQDKFFRSVIRDIVCIGENERAKMRKSDGGWFMNFSQCHAFFCYSIKFCIHSIVLPVSMIDHECGCLLPSNRTPLF